MKNEEHQIQKALIDLVSIAESRYPLLSMLYAIPNGGYRNIITGKRLKAEGVKRGIPDLFLPVARGGYNGFYIEVKTAKGRLSDWQKAWKTPLEEQGYKYSVIRSATDGLNALIDYLGSGE